MASRLDRASGVTHPRLRIALELSQDVEYTSSALAGQVIRETAAELDRYPRCCREAGLNKSAVWAAAASCIAIVISTTLTPRIFHYWDAPFTRVRFAAQVYPGTRRVAFHRNVTLRLVPRENVYRRTILRLGTPGGTFEKRHILNPDSTGAFSYTLRNVTKTVTYRFTPGTHTATPDTIIAVPPPRIRRLALTLIPPRYAGTGQRRITPGHGVVSVYPGTRMAVSLAAHTTLSSAALVRPRLNETAATPRARSVTPAYDTIALGLDNGGVRDTFPLSRQGGYRFLCRDSLGQTRDSLGPFSVTYRKDHAPSVRIVRPGKNLSLAETAEETLSVHAHDDLGVTGVTLFWWLSRKDSLHHRARALHDEHEGTPQWRSVLIWHLDNLTLYPGDTLFYAAQARDNSPYTPHTTSDTFWFRIPTFEEMHAQLARRQQDMQQQLSSAEDNVKELEEHIARMLREYNWKDTLSWEDRQVVKDVAQRIQTQRDSLANAVRSFRKSVNDMQHEGSLDPQLTDKMEKLHKSIREITEQFGDSVLFDLSSSDSMPSHRDIINSLERMKKELPELASQIDNALKYLEHLKTQQKLSELSQRAKKLAGQQKALLRPSDDDSAAVSQPAIVSRSASLVKDVAELERRHERHRFPARRQVDSIATHMQERIKSGAPVSKEAQLHMSGSLLSMSQQLDAAMTQTMAAQFQQDRKLLLHIAYNTLSLSSWQDELLRAGGIRPPDPGTHAHDTLLTHMESMRRGLASLHPLLDSLQTLSPFMVASLHTNFKNALRVMDSARAALRSSAHPLAMKQSRTVLNMLGAKLLSIVDMLDQSTQQAASSMQQPGSLLQKISGKQAMLNAMTSGLLQRSLSGRNPGEGPMGQRPSPGRKGERGQGGTAARRQARQAQQHIAKKLQELEEKYRSQGKHDQARHAQRLEQQARRIADMLANPPTEHSQHAQEQLLTRMLEASLSVHKQGQGGTRRKGKKSEQPFTRAASSPEVLSGDARTMELYLRIRRNVLNGEYPSSYTSSIHTYLDSLGTALFRTRQKE
jgi:hypothetical protein